MAVVLLEALGAAVLLVLIVWWTMFSGRKKGELPGHHDSPDATLPPAHEVAPDAETNALPADPLPADATDPAAEPATAPKR